MAGQTLAAAFVLPDAKRFVYIIQSICRPAAYYVGLSSDVKPATADTPHVDACDSSAFLSRIAGRPPGQQHTAATAMGHQPAECEPPRHIRILSTTWA